ncbi:MAG: hypothetical protein OEU93_02685 [Rubrivivax sp.]|nr:hypothetical protein [Rubrivivax sp.]
MNRAALALAAGLASAGSLAAPPSIFEGADLALGEKLIAEHGCNACHVRKVGGDGSAIYRPQGRINSPGALRGMVEYCNTELNLGLFPEETTAVAAVLQRDHYRFGQSTPARD